MTEIFYILEGEIELILDDKIVVASAGTTINIPQNVWHEAKSANGAKMLSIFSPAGFEDYLAEMKTLANEQFADEPFMRALNEKYDIWNE
jgi:quercetin dioxygenase-like cupin family protein